MSKKRKTHKTGSHEEWKPEIDHMMRYCGEILHLTEGMNFKEFVSHRCVYPATLRYIHLLGESPKKIPRKIRRKHPEISWRKMIVTRNHVAHNDEDIDTKMIMRVVKKKVPKLLPKLNKFKVISDKIYKDTDTYVEEFPEFHC